MDCQAPPEKLAINSTHHATSTPFSRLPDMYCSTQSTLFVSSVPPPPPPSVSLSLTLSAPAFLCVFRPARAGSSARGGCHRLMAARAFLRVQASAVAASPSFFFLFFFFLFSPFALALLWVHYIVVLSTAMRRGHAAAAS
jgi:hypothetical protein